MPILSSTAPLRASLSLQGSGDSCVTGGRHLCWSKSCATLRQNIGRPTHKGAASSFQALSAFTSLRVPVLSSSGNSCSSCTAFQSGSRPELGARWRLGGKGQKGVATSAQESGVLIEEVGASGKPPVLLWTVKHAKRRRCSTWFCCHQLLHSRHLPPLCTFNICSSTAPSIFDWFSVIRQTTPQNPVTVVNF